MRRRDRRGITLMETVVALAIVGTTAVAALGAVAADVRGADRAHRALEASALAWSQRAFLDLLTETELEALPDSVSSGRFAAPLQDYHWTTTTANRDAEQGVHDVAIKIDWPGGSYTLNSSIYRRPVLVSQ